MSRLRWNLSCIVLLALPVACAGDPYAGYAAAIHEDVDVAMVTAFKMTARLQLTVVHNRIPSDSFAVVAHIVTRAAREVRERAEHFAHVTPPHELVEPHADLSAELSKLAQALDALGSTFQRCVDASRAGDSTGRACEAHLKDVSSRFAFVGEDINNARTRVNRYLLPHGVMLPPIR